MRLPYPGEAGMRNKFRGDGVFDIDSSLAKSWNLGERARMKFAWEVFNVTNSVRFDDGHQTSISLTMSLLHQDLGITRRFWAKTVPSVTCSSVSASTSNT